MILQTYEEYKLLKIKTQAFSFLFIPIYEYGRKLHIAQNQVMSGFFYFWHDKSSYLANNTHPDAPCFDIWDLVCTSQKIFVGNKKEFLYHFNRENDLDMMALQYVKNTTISELEDFETSSHKHYNYVFRQNVRYIGKIVPLVKHYEMCRAYAEEIFDPTIEADIEHPLEFYSNVIIPTLQQIESAGLFVDLDKIKDKFPDAKVYNQKVYTEYRPFTITGRPSNAFDGINYAALNKTDGTREIFISRFGEYGQLLNFDFDGHHIRLLANHLNIGINEPSVHEYLAKQYYHTDKITDEMYAESKQQTFAILYGENQNLRTAPALLRSIKEYEKELWVNYQKDGYLKTPIAHRKIIVPDPSPSKVFNYFVQALESEATIQKLWVLLNRLSKFKSRIVLFVYDSILLDVSNDELEAVEAIVLEVLQEGGKFPVTVSRGNNYGEL